jgi:hypothetical protein
MKTQEKKISVEEHIRQWSGKNQTLQNNKMAGITIYFSIITKC